MRLIDVDLYCATICKCNRRACDRAKCPIHNAPTAYDINKVVEELNELDVKSITRYKNGNFGNFNGVEYYIKKRKAIEIVKQEAEQCNNGWIPRSERLPEENQEVILQDFYGNITIEKMKTNDGAKGFIDGDWWSSANNYVAWQPLPEPYKERD